MLLLTSADQPHDAASHPALNGFLVKPVGQRALLDAVCRVVGSRLTADKEPAAPAVTPTRSARRLRVLVAEDNPVNQRLAQHLLERRGHTPILAANGREALDLAMHDQFDLVLMDLQMPEMDGFETTASIRARERDARAPRLPIIALTAHAMQGDRQRCLDADMDGYVAKPIKPVGIVRGDRSGDGSRGEYCRRLMIWRVRDVIDLAGPRNVATVISRDPPHAPQSISD